MKPKELDTLIEDCLEGRLSEADAARLSAELQDSSEARARYWGSASIHGSLEHTMQQATLRVMTGRASVAPTRRLHWRPLMAAAACAMLISLAALWFSQRTVARVVQVIEATDVASWCSMDGRESVEIKEGQWLGAGTFTTRSENAHAVLAFEDGTRLTFSGDTDATITNNGQKRVNLRVGGLEAEVSPQPVGQPMLVRTPTALLHVIGTAFTVSADSQRTTLNVDHGRVRMERISDGSAIEVPEQQAADASLDTSVGLSTRTPVVPNTKWTRRFDLPPPPNWRGEWQPADESGPAHVRSVPCLAGRTVQGMPVIHFGITARASDSSFVTLTSRSVVRLRYRMSQLVPLRVMLTMQKPSGGFGGNFEAHVTGDDGKTTNDGWRTLEVPVASMKPLIAKYSTIPAVAQVSLLFITSYERAAGLEVSELTIAEPRL